VHPELSSIVQLWKHDSVLDRARADAGELKAAVQRLEHAIAAMDAEVLEVSAARDVLATDQGAVQRDLDRYIVRKNRSKELMKGGHSLDFGTVQKQLEQCSAKVDELEFAVLELMEKKEDHTDRLRTLGEDTERAKVSRTDAHDSWVREGRRLRTEMEEIWAIRQSAAVELAREQLARYEDFRKRGMEPVAAIDGKTCSGCHVVVASPLRMEVVNTKRLQACRGCGRWLLPPVASLELDEESLDA
jgi:predicted  nucleic acid-binding Zn-ribbon protein